MSLVNILRNINRDRFNPSYYSFRGGILTEAIKDLGIKMVIGSNKDPLSHKKGWTEEDANEERAYIDILTNELKKDYIAISLVFTCPDGVIASQKAGIPVIIERLDGPLILDKIKNKSCLDKIICESVTIKKLILGKKTDFKLKDEQIEVIYKGIDLGKFDKKHFISAEERASLGLNPEELVIGYTGRISQEKNLQLLIQSARVLISKYRMENFKVIIVGPDYGDLDNLKKLTLELDLNNKIIFTGMGKDIPAILSTFDIFAMTSIAEGVSTALIEAMAMGLPIVSTAVGAIPEIVDGNGFLVESFDPYDFAKKILILIKDINLRKKMGERSTVLSKKYNIKKTVKKYEKLFMDCLDEKHIS